MTTKKNIVTDLKNAFQAMKQTSNKLEVKELLALVKASALPTPVSVSGAFENVIAFELSDGSFGYCLTALNTNVKLERIELENLFKLTQKPEKFELNGVALERYSARTQIKPVTAVTEPPFDGGVPADNL